MIKCIVVDDEAYAIDIIAGFVEKTPALSLVGKFTSAIEALRFVQEGKADLVFLDIQMPELTGIQFLKIAGHQCKVIVTTAYPGFALEGFEHDVVDYIVKPVPFERFLRAVQKAQVHFQPASPAAPTAPPTNYMFVKGDSKHAFIKVNYQDILYIEGLQNYVVIHTTQQKIITYQRLSDLTESLPSPPFYRIHKSYIISLEHIQKIEGNTVHIAQQVLPVSETYRPLFYEQIKQR
ncbi:LytTR family two component transcriptional regulator [Chitinophaga skermanii]|uniref:LytTR family two component transcriptional regulator n=1 Tax=Chitinophaga skermanii TaxID=331697 RepID=A0A327QXS7_9BACT|nr:LytTR family DNA-binding domain-containing protein [Chitinophaga skermanii]RAJ08193.1 LytTR family two component transcriptional regulator [Chitinophaga skermanii]